MRGTRFKANGKSDAAPQSQEKCELPPNDSNPPRLLILNKKVSKDATVMIFAHPRTLAPTRYYVCPESGIFEFQKLATPSSAASSWLLQTSQSGNQNTSRINEQYDPDTPSLLADGYISRTPDVYTVTPFDPLFLLLPALEPQSSLHGDQAKRQFLENDDLFEQMLRFSKHFRSLTNSPFQKILDERLAAICDTVDVDNMKMYRLNDGKLFKELLSKAKAISTTGLPPSMEDKFVTRPLELPVSVNALAASLAAESSESKDSTSNSQEATGVQTASAPPSTTESQTSIDTTVTTPDFTGSAVEHYPQIQELQRLRTAFSFIVSAYVPPRLANFLSKRLSEPESGVDFMVLDAHLERIAKVKAEAAEARSLGDYSRKRCLEDDYLAAERAEKRQKQEEEEKRKKANESRGVRDLKKVNVTGMKKMSDFFKKTPAN